MPTIRIGTPTRHGKRRDRAHPDRRTDDEQRRHARDRRLGDREPDRPRERVDVGGRARDEVADPGPLDRRERQREHAAHEVVAQLGEHPLGEDERGAAREEREDRLRDEEDGEDRARRGRSRPCRSPSAGPARASRGAAARRGPAAAASACRTSTPIIARRWRPASSRAPGGASPAGVGDRAGARSCRSSPRVTTSR